jgi:hypothetical protein
MPTCQNMRDYFDWHCQIGRGACLVEVDWRSLLCSYSACQYTGIRPPSSDRMYDKERKVVFVDAVIEGAQE